MIKYPIGQQNFPYIRENGFIYIDKTELIYSLVNNSKYVFLSRPRRFGKSLLLSTIEAYFEGRRNLFEGLSIENLEKDWKKYPVLHLEFTRSRHDSHESLKEVLNQQFNKWEDKYGITSPNPEFGSRFADIIIQAFNKTGQRIVVLVDEYDNPLINTLDKEDIHYKNRNLLKSVYSNLKALDGYIRFGMLTGVSRFSKMSIFSGLNNLDDISFNNRYASICGFTEHEILSNYSEGLQGLSDSLNLSPEEALSVLKYHYDGYHFTEASPDMYNPFSLLKAFNEGKISNFWFSTGTPSFLVTKLKDARQPFAKIFNDRVTESSLAEEDGTFQSPVALLYQTGYLTIKDYDRETKRYNLRVPNREVEDSLFDYLLGAFTGNSTEDSFDAAHQLRQSLIDGNIEEFLTNLRYFLSEIPYDIIPKVTERYFQNTLYLMFRTMGLEVEAEKRYSFGRSDIILKTDKYIYIFELKLDGSPEEALRQIEEKGYALPYINESRQIIKIGLNFSSEKRNLADWQYKNR